MSQRVALIGFGEVGQALAADLHTRGVCNIAAWDIQFTNPASVPSRAAAKGSVRAAADAREAIVDAEVIVSAVTAAQDLAAASAVAAHAARQAYFLDLNSASPGVKQQAAQVIERAGARYVEAAIMSPIHPKRSASPMLFGGPHAHGFLPIARELGFTGAQVFAKEVGRASAAKMCRSVMIKGIEALLAESLLSARRYGVEDTVIDSLNNLLPTEDWRSLARYMISRSLLHGTRRAEEMREVAKTVAEAGIEPWMSRACVERQEWAAQFRALAEHEDLTSMLDAIRRSSNMPEELEIEPAADGPSPARG